MANEKVGTVSPQFKIGRDKLIQRLFSYRNIWSMRSLYLAWTEGFQKLPQAVAEIDVQNLLYSLQASKLARLISFILEP